MRGGTRGWQVRNARQSLRLSIDSSPYHSPYNNTSPESITPSSSTHASTTTCGTTPSSGVSADWHTQTTQQIIVVCKHDFDSADPDHLPFRADEILVIVKQEDSGWWAAMRPNENRLGWIPSAFVEPLKEEMGERLLSVREEMKVFDCEGGGLREAGLASDISNHPMIHFPESHEEDWVPVVEDVKAPSTQLVTPTDLVPGRQLSESGLLTGKSFDSFFCDTDEEESPVEPRFAQAPPSPTMAMPRPPLPRSQSFESPSLRGYQQSVYEPPSKHGRSRSDSTSGRHHHRRRPMYVDDRASLSRLSTLLESEEINLLSSPDINQSFDAFARIAMQQAEKNKQRQRDEASISDSPKSPQPQGHWYLRPSYSDELKVDSDGQVKAGTLRALVEKLTTDPIRAHDLEFRKIFLLTFRSFVTPERLFDLLVERFEMRGPNNLAPQEVEEWKEKKLRPVQNRVLTVMTMWLEDYHLLDEEPEISQKLTSFLSAIVTPSHLALTAKLILQSLERMTFAHPISLSHQASRKSRKPKTHKNDLLRWNPDELVEQLCLIEHKYYAKIRPQECLNWAKVQTGQEVENITTFCNTHDQLAAWVKVSILNSDVLGKRADTVDFWIRVADKCRNIHNFHSMSAVVAGLSSTVIARLHLTWSHCSRKSQYDALMKFCDPLSGFSGYKHLLQSTEGPCIPYVRMFLTDVIQIQGQYTDTIPLSASQGDVAFISFTKRQKWHDAVSAMLRYQLKPYQFAVDQSARSFIEGVLYSSGTAGQDWFWLKSQEIQQSELAHADIRKGLEAAGF